MIRRWVAIAVVGITLLTAGCLGSGDHAEPSPTPPPLPSLDEVQYPPGFNESGVVDSSTAYNTHWEKLRTLSSYAQTERRVTRLAPDQRAASRNATFAQNFTINGSVSFDQRRAYFTARIEDEHVSSYAEGDTSWRYEGDPTDGPTRSAIEASTINFTRDVGAYGRMGRYLSAYDFEPTAVTRHEGLTAIEYEVGGPASGATEENVSHRGNLLVSTEGILLEMDVGSYGDAAFGEYEFRAYDVNETDVRRPDWVPDESQG